MGARSAVQRGCRALPKLDPRSEWTGGGLTTNPTMLVEFYAALAGGRVETKESLSAVADATAGQVLTIEA